jgi:S-adenosylmethionine:tRNA ribosyltransferase-isomerase
MSQHPSKLSISDFTYELPAERIARFPLAERTQSKLLCFKEGKISEDLFRNIGAQLPAGARLIFNETRVIPARLFFYNKNGGRIEVFCLEPAPQYHSAGEGLSTAASVQWQCLVGNLRSWKEEVLSITKETITLQARLDEKQKGSVLITFEWTPAGKTFEEIVAHFGQLPIPPYLNRATEESDLINYQTAYARVKGSVAAPTAGLHFTEPLLEELKEAGFGIEKLVLHVGAGTFLPVKSDTLEGHDMHAEFMEVHVDLIQGLATLSDQLIVAVGTTSLRSLESLYWMGLKSFQNPDAVLSDLEVQQWDPYREDLPVLSLAQSLSALVAWMTKNKKQVLICKTRILIAPPYTLKVAGGIITNFHQPQSTLLLLIAAVVGDKWRSIYDYALAHDFRFLSYGDSSLLLKTESMTQP